MTTPIGCNPIPWKLLDHNKDFPSKSRQVGFRPLDIHDANDQRVMRAGELAEDIPNAEFIVRAVNSHDALVEALQTAHQLLDVHGTIHPEDWGSMKEGVFEKISEAIKKANELGI